ncbi:MAG: hypothetical protein R3D71_00300 [Rickettsiales bacterium]
MDKIEKLIDEIIKSPKNVRFSDLSKVCTYYFGKPRNSGTSHYVYKMPWQGDPRVNIQNTRDGKAKIYQVKQVLFAIKKLKEEEND